MRLFYHFNRIFWYPFLRYLFPMVNGKARERVTFELSMQDSDFRSFKQDGLQADYAFECSSEGEFEQIIPMVKYLLDYQKKVELIYCSESVDHRCRDLYQKYPLNLRIYRLPILSFFPVVRDPNSWLTAPHFFLCRYDFFPELIFYGRRSKVQFYLLWAMGSDSAPPGSWYYHWVYKSFDKIIAATTKDKLFLQAKYGHSEDSMAAYDFRPVQIASRLKLREESLNKKVPHYAIVQNFINSYPKQRRIIFGSFWINELPILSSAAAMKFLNDRGLAVIVPHDLSTRNLVEIAKGFKETGIHCLELNQHMSVEQLEKSLASINDGPSVLLINLKGILCELYADFATAFVGGGHGLSIHSVLEPYIAGCNVYCGPKVHRSTEYQLILSRDPEKIHIVEQLDQFFTFIQKDLNLEYKESSVHLDGYIEANQEILQWLNLSH